MQMDVSQFGSLRREEASKGQGLPLAARSVLSLSSHSSWRLQCATEGRESELGQLLPWCDGHRDLNFQEVIRDRQLGKGCVYLAPNPCQTLYLLLST